MNIRESIVGLYFNISLFINFMEEKDIYEKFVGCHELHSRADNKSLDYMYRNITPKNWIDYPIYWEKTNNGYEYWLEIEDQWHNYLDNTKEEIEKIKKQMCENTNRLKKLQKMNWIYDLKLIK